MPDSETFKLIVNGGSFALIVLMFVWLLFKGVPDHRAAVVQMTTDLRVAIEREATAQERQAEEYRKSMQLVCDTFSAALAKQFEECREERREMMKDFEAAIKEEFELNRETRHQTANTVQKAIIEMYKGRDRDRNDRNEGGGSKGHKPIGPE